MSKSKIKSLSKLGKSFEKKLDKTTRTFHKGLVKTVGNIKFGKPMNIYDDFYNSPYKTRRKKK